MSLSLCSAAELIHLNQSKEFTLLASGIKKNLICHTDLNSPEKLFWEYLYEQAKFNNNLEVKLSISEMAAAVNKSDRTISRYLSKLKKYGYLEISHNYNSIGQTINTYYVRVPVDVVKTIGATKDRAKPDYQNYDGLPPKQELTPHDKFVAPNNRDLNNSNNVASFSEEDFLSAPFESGQDVGKVVELESFAKPVSEDRQITIHHILRGRTVVENALSELLTAKQKAVIAAVLTFWQERKKISNIKEAFAWIEHQLLRKESFRQTSFLGRLSIINKMLRQGSYSKPNSLYVSRKTYQIIAPATPQPSADDLMEKERQKIAFPTYEATELLELHHGGLKARLTFCEQNLNAIYQHSVSEGNRTWLALKQAEAARPWIDEINTIRALITLSVEQYHAKQQTHLAALKQQLRALPRGAKTMRERLNQKIDCLEQSL